MHSCCAVLLPSSVVPSRTLLAYTSLFPCLTIYRSMTSASLLPIDDASPRLALANPTSEERS
jgi:hypothetical protein